MAEQLMDKYGQRISDSVYTILCDPQQRAASIRERKTDRRNAAD